MEIPLNVLFIKETDFFTETLIHVLELNSYKVFYEGVNIDTLTKALDQKPWDIIIADYHLPKFNSIKAVNILRNKRIEIPFVIAIAETEEAVAFDITTEDDEGHLSKSKMTSFIPVIKKELREVAMKAIPQKLRKGQLNQAPSLEAVGRLAGEIAHDFNNVLSIITLCCDKLKRRQALCDQSFKDLEQISKASELGSKLIKQLLAFSRNQVFKLEILNLNAVIINIEEMLKVLLGKEVILELVLQEPLEKVSVDPGQMEQIIINLAINARDAMPSGGRLTLRTANAELNELSPEYPIAIPGKYLMFSAQDTGQGMDLKTQQKIFDPFFSTKGNKGTGIGLSTVYGIVKQSGGYIFVYSEPRSGATFKIFLPLFNASESIL
jgi:two-component system cell cycle sensor histidine kinase/response regulator CckA